MQDYSQYDFILFAVIINYVISCGLLATYFLSLVIINDVSLYEIIVNITLFWC